ncbi:MAG TPA: STAS domain-containing protein [Planctomycetota bacterium]|nr:STAS domain-containing protein [Planctomycetota bacterium]
MHHGKGSMTSDRSTHSNSDHRKPNGLKQESGTAKDYIAVARGADLVVIRVVGKGNMITASALAEFAEQQRKAGFKRFVFDMERCNGLDSTFMGVMVGMQTALSKSSESQALPKIQPDTQPSELRELSPEEAAATLANELAGKSATDRQSTLNSDGGQGVISAVNVSPEVRDLMNMLGVDKFVKLRGSCDLKSIETTILSERNVPAEERRRLILKAHETLVEVDKRNLAQFGPFLKTLSMELSKE